MSSSLFNYKMSYMQYIWDICGENLGKGMKYSSFQT